MSYDTLFKLSTIAPLYFHMKSIILDDYVYKLKNRLFANENKLVFNDKLS